MGFKKKLSFTSFANNNDEDKYWMLVWYGAITFDPREREYLVDAYFIKRSNTSYYINEKISVIEKLTINFRKLLIFPLGSFFDYTGRLEKLPKNTSRGIMDGIKSLYVDTDLKGIDGNLKSSNFFKLLSELDPDLIESSLLYIKDHNNNYTIIPNYVLFKYFYYYSESSVKNIINDELRDSIKKEKIDNENYLFFNSKIIKNEDIKFLGKYFYTYKNFGEDVMYDIGNQFYLLKLKKKGELKYYLQKNIIPFKNILEYSILGFYIENSKIQKNTDSNGPNIFIVSDIQSSIAYVNKRNINTKELEQKVEKFPLFIESKIKYIDINKLKENNFSNENGQGVTQNNGPGLIIDDNIKNYIIDNPENTLSEAINLSQEVNIFNLSPDLHEIENEELNKIVILINQNNGLKRIISNINLNQSKETIIEYIKVNLDYYALTKIALNTLRDDSEFRTIFLFKETYKDIKNEFYSVSYLNQNYYVIESGRGFYSVILRKKDRSEISYEDLKFIHRTATDVYRLNWSLIKSKNKLNNFGLLILTPNKHKIVIDKELNVDIPKTILKMKDKFKKKIQDDNL